MRNREFGNLFAMKKNVIPCVVFSGSRNSLDKGLLSIIVAHLPWLLLY